MASGSLVEDLRFVFEGGLPIGTKRKRSRGLFKKIKRGVWKRISLGREKKPLEISVSSKFFDLLAQKNPGYQPPKPGVPPKLGSLAPILPGKKWTLAKHEYESSEAQHKTRGGDWTPERRALHKQIFDHFLNHVPPVPKDKQPMAIMMMGGPATGKGELTAQIPSKSYVKVDADSIKEMLPEYQQMVKDGDRDAASYVHKESGELASRMRDMARKQRKNMVLDGTGRFAGSYQHRMGELQTSGYHVQLMMPAVDDLETVVSRAKQRAAEKGRWVPEDFIRDNHEPIMRNFLSLAKNADSAFLFNNNGDKPRLAWARFGEWEAEGDSKYYETFRKKYGKESKGEEWEFSSGLVAELAGLLEDKEPQFDPREIVKNVLAQIEPITKKDKRFEPDEGILEPEPAGGI
jgi:predicted ABC-type ATPase